MAIATLDPCGTRAIDSSTNAYMADSCAEALFSAACIVGSTAAELALLAETLFTMASSDLSGVHVGECSIACLRVL